jgi:hypothetical protein
LKLITFRFLSTVDTLAATRDTLPLPPAQS